MWWWLAVLVALAGNTQARQPWESGLTNQPTVMQPEAPLPAVPAPAIGTVEIPVASDQAPPPPPPPKPRAPLGRPASARDLFEGALTAPRPVVPSPVTGAVTNVVASQEAEEERTTFGGRYRYVASDGSDDNDGTAARPWRTIQQAAARVEPGDVVVVRAGVYEAFHTVRGGTAEKPVTFRAEGEVIIGPAGGVAPVDLKPTTVRDLHRVDNIHIRDTDYVIVEGFTVQRAGRAGIAAVDCRGIVLRHNVVGPSGRWGIFTGFVPDLQIVSNKTFGSAIEHGIYVSNSRVDPDNVVIAYNESYDNKGNGIQVNGDCMSGGDGSITGVRLEGNRVYRNGLKGLSLISMSDSVVQNNVIFDNGLDAGAGGIHLTDEIGCGKASCNNVVVNNTVVEPRIACVRITDGATKNVLFNNLLVGNRPLIDEVGGNQICPDSNVRVAGALGIFNNPDAGDFRPLLISPARERGVAEYAGRRAPWLDQEGRPRRPLGKWNAGAY